MKKTVLQIAAILLLFSCSTKVEEQLGVELDPSYYTDLYGWNEDGGVSRTMLGRGINMGNYLEADGGEGAWTGGRKIQSSDFVNIRNQGFTTVRIPMRWGDNAGVSEPFTLDSDFLARAKEVVTWALEADLKAVINVHHYVDMMNESNRKDYHISRLKEIWSQLFNEFSLNDYPADKVVFEFLNEPNGAIGYSDWNSILQDLSQMLWSHPSQTGRKIMIGTANWGGVPGLYELDLPDDCSPENTIITVHYYEPFHFTHYGASWVEGSHNWTDNQWFGSEKEQAPLIKLFEDIEAWNQGKDFEIFVGEFGVYTEYSDKAQQQAWTAFICREAEKRDFSWAYWEYASGFGAYDPVDERWRSSLIKALIPENK